MTFMLLNGHQSATASRPAQVSMRSAPPAPSVSQESSVTRVSTPAQVTTPTQATTPEHESVSLSLPVQPSLSFQASFPTTFQATTPAPLSKASAAKTKDGLLNHQHAAASIGISPGLLNCYVAIYRSLGGQMPVQHGAAGFERRYAPQLVAGFASVRQQVREGADIRSAMAALQLRQQDTKTSKTKKRKDHTKLEHLLELNAHLSQQVSELRSELTAIKQQTVHAKDAPAEDSQDVAA